MLAGHSKRIFIKVYSPQYNGKLLLSSTKQTTGHGNKHSTNPSSSYKQQLDVVTTASSSWTKSTFAEFTEKMFLHRFEYLLEKTSYMEELRKSKKRMLEIQNKLHENADKRRGIINELHCLQFGGGSDNGKRLPASTAMNTTMAKQLWSEYNKLVNEEVALSSRSVLSINEAYEAEKLHTKFMSAVSVLLAIAGSLITLSLSYVIRKEHLQQQPQIPNLCVNCIATAKSQQNNESWTSYLHSKSRWMYSWMDRFKS
ncbi:uncharacterized protein [Musca autumnalis]|uniref:uncharacterized protein n=1 Tax=Musca autumnalis TaxID=221902 RepID=UPI003CE710FE